MAEKAFLQIKEAEAQAQIIIMNAGEEATKIIKRAEEETSDAFSRLSAMSRQQAQEKKKQAEITVHTNSAAFSKETAENCAALKRKLLSQKEKVVDAVIQIIAM